MHKGKEKVCPDGKPLGDQGVIQREPAQEVNLFIHNLLSGARMGSMHLLATKNPRPGSGDS